MDDDLTNTGTVEENHPVTLSQSTQDALKRLTNNQTNTDTHTQPAEQ